MAVYRFNVNMNNIYLPTGLDVYTMMKKYVLFHAFPFEKNVYRGCANSSDTVLDCHYPAQLTNSSQQYISFWNNQQQPSFPISRRNCIPWIAVETVMTLSD